MCNARTYAASPSPPSPPRGRARPSSGVLGAREAQVQHVGAREAGAVEPEADLAGLEGGVQFLLLRGRVCACRVVFVFVFGIG